MLKDRDRVVGVEVGLQESYRHGPHQGGQTLTQNRKMPEHIRIYIL